MKVLMLIAWIMKMESGCLSKAMMLPSNINSSRIFIYFSLLICMLTSSGDSFASILNLLNLMPLITHNENNSSLLSKERRRARARLSEWVVECKNASYPINTYPYNFRVYYEGWRGAVRLDTTIRDHQNLGNSNNSTSRRRLTWVKRKFDIYMKH